MSSATAGAIVLVDRIWHNSGLSATITTSQTVNSNAWPARDDNESTNGEGVLVGMEVHAATGTRNAGQFVFRIHKPGRKQPADREQIYQR